MPGVILLSYTDIRKNKVYAFVFIASLKFEPIIYNTWQENNIFGLTLSQK